AHLPVPYSTRHGSLSVPRRCSRYCRSNRNFGRHTGRYGTPGAGVPARRVAVRARAPAPRRAFVRGHATPRGRAAPLAARLHAYPAVCLDGFPAELDVPSVAHCAEIHEYANPAIELLTREQSNLSPVITPGHTS